MAIREITVAPSVKAGYDNPFIDPKGPAQWFRDTRALAYFWSVLVFFLITIPQVWVWFTGGPILLMLAKFTASTWISWYIYCKLIKRIETLIDDLLDAQIIEAKSAKNPIGHQEHKLAIKRTADKLAFLQRVKSGMDREKLGTEGGIRHTVLLPWRQMTWTNLMVHYSSIESAIDTLKTFETDLARIPALERGIAGATTAEEKRHLESGLSSLRSGIALREGTLQKTLEAIPPLKYTASRRLFWYIYEGEKFLAAISIMDSLALVGLIQPYL